MEIRKATMEDFDSVFELKLELKELARKFNKTLPPVSEAKQHYEKYLREAISSENSAVFAAFDGNQAAAMIVAKVYQPLPIYGRGKRGYLSNLFVKEEFRRNKIGTKLMEKAIEWLQSKNAITATGEIYRENTHSLELTRSLGFKEQSVKILKEL